MGIFLRPLAFGGLSAGAGLYIAQNFFPEVRLMAACALTAFGLSPYLQTLLEKNRKEIWEDRLSPWVANRSLAFELAAIFGGIFAAACVSQYFFAAAAGLRGVERMYENSIAGLVQHNIAVLCAGVLLAILYRAAGLMLVLSWNALHWAETLFSTIQAAGTRGGVTDAVQLAAAIVPHLLLEVLAYVVGGMAGVFLSKALCKYSWFTAEFRRVCFACLTLIVISLGTLAAAAAVEVWLAQPAFRQIVARVQ